MTWDEFWNVVSGWMDAGFSRVEELSRIKSMRMKALQEKEEEAKRKQEAERAAVMAAEAQKLEAARLQELERKKQERSLLPIKLRPVMAIACMGSDPVVLKMVRIALVLKRIH